MYSRGVVDLNTCFYGGMSLAFSEDKRTDMNRHNVANTPIDCFVWKRETAQKDKLVYYDKSGVCFERSVDSDSLDGALKIFSGQTRAVRRSSGGLVMAEPLQIVVYENQEQASPIHIKVRFREALPQAERGTKTSRPCTKVVAAEELFEAFCWDFEGPRKQTFALDFGQGIVPVHPFYYHQSEHGTDAYFLDASDWELATGNANRGRVAVKIYRISRSALRWTGPAAVGGNPKVLPTEAERALKNVDRLRSLQATIVPEVFRFGDSIEVPSSGANPEDIRHYLRICIQKQLLGTPVHIDVRPKEEELLPFGLFEE